MSSAPRYGKTIDEASYMNGTVTSVKRSVEETVSVDGLLQVLDVISNALKELPQTADLKMTFEIHANRKTLQPTLVKRRWQIERSAQ